MMPKIRSTVAAFGLLSLCALAQAENLRLIFAGDLMLDDGPGQTIAAGGDPLKPLD